MSFSIRIQPVNLRHALGWLAMRGMWITLFAGLVACGADDEPAGDAGAQTDVDADTSPDAADDASPSESDASELDTGAPDTEAPDSDDADDSTPDDAGDDDAVDGDTVDDDTTDEDVPPDTVPDVSEPDPAAVAEALERASVTTYLEAASAGEDAASCEPDQPAAGGTDTCTDDAACDDGLQCRNVRVFALDSRCSCVAAAACADLTCDAGQRCLAGTRSVQTLCGGGLNSVLCNDTCVPGTCASDDDCGTDERCIVVRDVCGNLSGLACTPSAGSGCLGIDDACGADEACLPTLTGSWTCVATDLACD